MKIMNIREIKLFSFDKKNSISLNDTRFLAGKISGLGNNYSISYHETSTRKVHQSIKPDFEPISITIYFNVEGNPYRNYKYLMNFLMQNIGKVFPLEYSDGIKTKYCDVILKSIPKSEIDEEGVFCETFTFERQYYWYEEHEESFALKTIDSSKVTYPLPFPFGFAGISFVNKYTITNNFFIDAPVKIEINGPIGNNPILIKLNDETNSLTLKEIRINSNCSIGEKIIIDSANKKITKISDEIEENAYQLTDKTKQSFLYLPLGTFNIVSNLELTDKGSIEISIKRYLLD